MELVTFYNLNLKKQRLNNAEGDIYLDDQYFYKIYRKNALKHVDHLKTMIAYFQEHPEVKGTVKTAEIITKHDVLRGIKDPNLASSKTLYELSIKARSCEKAGFLHDLVVTSYCDAVFQSSVLLQGFHENSLFVTDLHFENIMADPDGVVHYVDKESFSLPDDHGYYFPGVTGDFLRYFMEDGQKLEQLIGPKLDQISFWVNYLCDNFKVCHPAKWLYDPVLKSRGFSQEGIYFIDQFICDNPLKMDIPYYHEVVKEKER